MISSVHSFHITGKNRRRESYIELKEVPYTYLQGTCNKASYGCLEHLFSRFTPLLCHLLPSCFLPAKADILCLFSSKGPVHAHACRDTKKQPTAAGGGGGAEKRYRSFNSALMLHIHSWRCQSTFFKEFIKL